LNQRAHNRSLAIKSLLFDMGWLVVDLAAEWMFAGVLAKVLATSATRIT
jgi:hypothetical protein